MLSNLVQYTCTLTTPPLNAFGVNTVNTIKKPVVEHMGELPGIVIVDYQLPQNKYS